MRCRKWTFIILSIVLCFSIQQASFAKKKKSKIVDIDFDDELQIKGKLLGPSLFSLFQKKSMHHGKLIKPRKNFLREMRATAQDIE